MPIADIENAAVEIRAALSRLSSPGAQQFSHWRPIDAEARSSGRILAAELKRPNEWWVRICSWAADRNQEGFWSTGGNDESFPFMPTLWMPIPSPGVQQRAGENDNPYGPSTMDDEAHRE